MTEENIEDVLNLAKLSLVDEFYKECVRFLAELLTLNNLCWIYQLAIVYDIENLKDVKR